MRTTTLTFLGLWVSTPLASSTDEPFECLAKNVYFEARGESLAGRIAVAIVTLNRVVDKRWPKTICGVVWQPYQFSWTKDGLSDNPIDMGAWSDSKYAAEVALSLHTVKDANHYHNNTVMPNWAVKNRVSIYDGYLGNHLYYTIPK